MIRGRLIRISENEQALLITIAPHRVRCWSMGVLIHELSTLYYTRLYVTEADPLPELEMQFPDYAYGNASGLRARPYVNRPLLEGLSHPSTTLLELPTDHPRPAEQNFAGGFVEIALDEQLTARLKELSRRHRTTLYMTLLQPGLRNGTAFQSAGCDHRISVRPTVAKRKLRILSGFFVNTLASEDRSVWSPKVGELLKRAKTRSLAAQQNQDIPFERVVELVQPVRSLSYSRSARLCSTGRTCPGKPLACRQRNTVSRRGTPDVWPSSTSHSTYRHVMVTSGAESSMQLRYSSGPPSSDIGGTF